MKKSLLILFLAATVSDVFAQDYYTGKSTVTANGITYHVESQFDNYMLCVYDQTNTREPFAPLRYHNGTEADRKRLGRLLYLVAHNENEILTSTFTKEEYAKLQKTQNNSFYVALIVSPEGDVIEVYFYFKPLSEFLALSPEKLALLERNIKKLVKWKVTEEGKKLKYTYSMWLIDFSKNLFYPGEVQPYHPLNNGGGN